MHRTTWNVSGPGLTGGRGVRHSWDLHGAGYLLAILLNLWSAYKDLEALHGGGVTHHTLLDIINGIAHKAQVCRQCHNAQALRAWRRVNLELPIVEVRFENLHIETEVYAETSRQLPSLWNAVRSSVEVSSHMGCHCTAH